MFNSVYKFIQGNIFSNFEFWKFRCWKEIFLFQEE